MVRFAGFRQIDGDGFDGGRSGCALPGRLAARVNEDEPGPLRALQHGFHALPVVPAVDGHGTVADRNAGHMGVGASAQALGHAGQNAIPARGRRRDDERGLGRFAEGFGGGGIGGVAGLGEVRAGHAEELRGAAGGDGWRRLDVFTDQPDDER